MVKLWWWMTSKLQQWKWSLSYSVCSILISLKLNCVSNLMFLETIGGSCDNGNARMSWWQATQSRWQFWSGSAFAGNNSRLRAKLITRYFQITGPHMKGDIKIMAIYISALYQGNADVILYTFGAVLVHHSHDHHQSDRCLEIFSWGRTVSIGASQETRHLCVNASVYVETLSDWIWKQFSSSLDWLLLTEQSSSLFDDHRLQNIQCPMYISSKSLAHYVATPRYCLWAFVMWVATSLPIIVLGRLHKVRIPPIFALIFISNYSSMLTNRFIFISKHSVIKAFDLTLNCVFSSLAGVKYGRYGDGDQKPNTPNHIPHWSEPIAANMTANLHSQ